MWGFLHTAELSSLFQTSILPNKPSPVSFPNSSIIPNSSYSLYLFYNNRHTISQRKMANPSNTCHSLVLSNHSPTYLPFHKPSHPLTFCLSLTLLSIHLFLHSPTYFSSCPICPLIFSPISPFSPPSMDPLTPSLCTPSFPSTHLPCHPLVLHLPPSILSSWHSFILHSVYSFIRLSSC